MSSFPAKVSANQESQPALTDTQKREYLAQYFADFQIGKDNSTLSKLRPYIIIAIVAALIVYLINSTLGLLVAIVMAGALFALYQYDSNRHRKGDDSIVDEIRKSDIASLIQRGRLKLGIDKAMTDEDLTSSDPNVQVNRERVITGPVLVAQLGIPADHVCMRKGRDGYLRFSCYDHTFTYLTPRYLAIYRCIFDSISGSPKNEKFVEYNYRDITSVRTVENELVVKLKTTDVKLKTLRFEIAVASDNVSVSFTSSELSDKLEGNLLDVSTDEDLNVLRSYIRTKKQNPKLDTGSL